MLLLCMPIPNGVGSSLKMALGHTGVQLHVMVDLLGLRCRFLPPTTLIRYPLNFRHPLNFEAVA
jgi:hypothetical protein